MSDNTKTQTNVKSINASDGQPIKRGPGRPKTEKTGDDQSAAKKRKQRQGEIDRLLRQIASGKESTTVGQVTIPPLPQKYCAIKTSREIGGAVCQIENNHLGNPTATLASSDEWAEDLQHHLEIHAIEDAACLNVGMIKTQQCTAGLARGKNATLKEFPPVYGFASDPWVCLDRLAFDPVGSVGLTAGETPRDWRFADSVAGWTDHQRRKLIYDMFRDCPEFVNAIARMDDENWWPFLARLGSLFFPDANRKQLVWLWGDSDAGKSTFLHALLTALLGHVGKGVWVPMDEEDFDDPFWTADILRARAVVFAEVSSGFLGHRKMLGMLGEKHRRVRRKNQDSVRVEQQVMVFCHSNPAPMTEDRPELRNRLIAVHMKGIPPDQQLDETIIFAKYAEYAPRIIAACIAIYKSLCPHSKTALPCDKTTFERGASIVHDEDLAVFESNFSVGPKTFVSTARLKTILIGEGYRTTADRQKWKDVICRKYPQIEVDAREDRVTGKGGRTRGWGNVFERLTPNQNPDAAVLGPVVPK